jgi:hypothetical protein
VTYVFVIQQSTQKFQGSAYRRKECLRRRRLLHIASLPLLLAQKQLGFRPAGPIMPSKTPRRCFRQPERATSSSRPRTQQTVSAASEATAPPFRQERQDRKAAPPLDLYGGLARNKKPGVGERTAGGFPGGLFARWMNPVNDWKQRID